MDSEQGETVMKKILGRTFKIARGTALALGVGMMLALTVGLASEALGANGGSLILGKATNVATSVTGLVGRVASGAALLVSNPSGGAALDLRVQPGKAPIKVNSSGKVSNLNADQIDGLDSQTFQRSGTKAADADRLDGKDSTAFLASDVYTVSAVSEEIQPGFGRGAQALCDAGDVALSGGYRDINANLKVYIDQRVDENVDPERGPVHPSGWEAVGLNPPDGGIGGVLEVQAYCADLPPARG